MKLSFFGANRQVTGSCYLLEAAGLRLLVDCGLYQERCCLARNWAPFPFEPRTVDGLLLTHAHLDHTGLLPRLGRHGFEREVLATRPTVELSAIVLEDAAHLQDEDAAHKRRRHEREGRQGPHPLEPLYTRDDVTAILKRFKPVDYEKPVALSPEVEVRFHDAGHILGSAIIEVVAVEDGRTTRVVFSGDLGQWGGPLVVDPAKIPEADYLVMESTYGDRDHQGRGEIDDHLARIVTETVARGGSVIIPTFAIDRAQDLLYCFSRLANQDRIPRVGIYLDSPMAIDVTSIYKRYPHLLDRETRDLLERGENPFQFRGLHLVRSPEESRRLIESPGSRVVLAGSGMCTGGRIKHHLRRDISRVESTIVFVGYQAEETLGREILDGAKTVRIHGEEFRVRAAIEPVSGLSAHADQSGLLRWLDAFRSAPRHVFLTHGEQSAAESLAGHIGSRPGWKVSVPAYRDGVVLA